MKKTLLHAALVSTLLLAACNGSTTPQPNGDETSSLPAMEQTASSAAATQGQGKSSAKEESVATTHVIDITAENFTFTPSTIMVKKGEKVSLRITGKNGKHGFAIPGLGVNLSIAAGQTVTVALPTDTAGEFDFFCSIPCGPGHTGMKGAIVITE